MKAVNRRRRIRIRRDADYYPIAGYNNNKL